MTNAALAALTCTLLWYAQHNTLEWVADYRGQECAGLCDGYYADTYCEALGKESLFFVRDGSGQWQRLRLQSADCTQAAHAKEARRRLYDGLYYGGDFSIQLYDRLSLPKMRPVVAIKCEVLTHDNLREIRE